MFSPTPFLALTLAAIGATTAVAADTAAPTAAPTPLVTPSRWMERPFDAYIETLESNVGDDKFYASDISTRICVISKAADTCLISYDVSGFDSLGSVNGCAIPHAIAGGKCTDEVLKTCKPEVFTVGYRAGLVWKLDNEGPVGTTSPPTSAPTPTPTPTPTSTPTTTPTPTPFVMPTKWMERPFDAFIDFLETTVGDDNNYASDIKTRICVVSKAYDTCLISYEMMTFDSLGSVNACVVPHAISGGKCTDEVLKTCELKSFTVGYRAGLVWQLSGGEPVVTTSPPASNCPTGDEKPAPASRWLRAEN